jgi:UDP-N-acetylglucosamine 2-epimerase (non-hydrolysing)
VDLDVMEPNQTLASLTSRVLTKLDALFASERPDLVLAEGDTTSVLAAALCCFYRGIPFGHVEAGLRTHDLQNPFPEEMNRVIAGLAASIHFAPTERASRNLFQEGIDSAKVHRTGNTVIDALLQVAQMNLPCEYPKDPMRKLVLVTSHRRENFGDPLQRICRAIATAHDLWPMLEFVYPVHPNPNVRSVVQSALAGLDRVYLIDPLDYGGLTSLMKQSWIVLTDSGGIQEEAPALGKPVLILRDETERPEAVEFGVARLVGTNTSTILSEIRQLLESPEHYRSMARGASPYGDGRAAERIAALCSAFLGCHHPVPADLELSLTTVP